MSLSDGKSDRASLWTEIRLLVAGWCVGKAALLYAQCGQIDQSKGCLWVMDRGLERLGMDCSKLPRGPELEGWMKRYVECHNAPKASGTLH